MMIAEEKENFALYLSDVMSFYSQPISNFIIDVWWSACEKYDFDRIKKAFNLHVLDPDRGRFYPKPGDIVQKIEGTVTERSLLAFGKMFSAIKRVGQYSNLIFDDAAIHAAIEDMGGWPKLCAIEEKNISFFQHQFTELYCAYAQKDFYLYPPVIIGIVGSDDEFKKNGIQPPKHVIIGDAKKAKKVYETAKKINNNSKIIETICPKKNACLVKNGL